MSEQCLICVHRFLASSRRSVSHGAVQKTAREKIEKRSESFPLPRFSLFFARCFLRCALLTKRLEEANRSPSINTRGAFHSTKIPGLNFRNFRMSNGTVFSTRPDRSRSTPAWAHFPLRITWENAEGSWWSGCFKRHIKLLHVEKFNTHSEFNSSFMFTPRETYEFFSRESVQTRRTDSQFSEKSDRNGFVENGRSRAGSNYGRSFCILCSVASKDSPPGSIHTG